jgi:acyl carrier protein
MTDQAGIAATTRQIITRELCVDPDDVVDGAHLLDDLGADSLDLVEVTLEVEQAFGVEVTDDEAEACRTVADWVALAGRKVDGKAGR